MEISLGTPALLFPAISLLLLAYTNRFLAIANLIRGLHARYKESRDLLLIGQIRNLRTRLFLIRAMQGLGVLSLLMCVLCMFALFAGQMAAGKGLFGVSLVLLMGSLGCSVREIAVSTVALEIQLSDLERDPRVIGMTETAPATATKMATRNHGVEDSADLTPGPVPVP